MPGIFLAAFSYVAALMGAGFASGQETLTFFSVFSEYGIIGIAAASLIIGIFGGMVSEYAFAYGKDYNEITSTLFSCRTGRVIDMLTFFFSICTAAVMCACFGELMNMLFGINKLLGAVLLAGVTTLVLFTGSEGTAAVNAAIGVIMFIAAATVCLYLLGYREHQTFAPIGAAVSGINYAGYNLITSGTILASGRIFLKKRGDGFVAGAVSGIMIFILLTLMWGIISIYYGKINLGELPMMTLALRESRELALFYGLIIAAAVFTTSISNGLCASQYLEGYLPNKAGAIIVMLLSLILSCVGFSGLIDTVYRYCGAAGIILAFALIFRIKKYKKIDKQRF